MRGIEANEAFARYTAIAVLAGLDTVLGGLRAWLDDAFDDLVFISGFFVNALLAAGLVLLGEKIGLETGVGDGRISVMMVGAVVVFSSRILNNLAVLRRLIINHWRARRDDNMHHESEVMANETAMSDKSAEENRKIALPN